jgi:ribosomal protein S21
MASIKIKVQGSIDRALREFKRRCIDANIFNELKRVAYYEKPSELRRRQGQKDTRTAQRKTQHKTPGKPSHKIQQYRSKF